jgi:WD40-like Beta Propeller Repeat
MKRAVRRHVAAAIGIAAAWSIVVAGVAQAMQFTSWSTAQKIDEINDNSSELNTPFVDGCPIQSPDGLSLYQASSRPGGMGGLDIWVAQRASADEPFGAPANLGAPINSAADEFCPTPVRGNGLYFVSRKVVAGVSCGLGDIYFTRRNPGHGWPEPVHLGCSPAGPNTTLDEMGPSYIEIDGHGLLYFSSSRTAAQGGLVPGDIYVSEQSADGTFGAPSPVTALNSPTANDIQPNVRKDGLEVVLSSDRAGTLGGQDVWAATRDSVGDPWSAPVDLGAAVNTGASETRPSLSWRADQLLFGRAPGPEGMSDIYVTTREKLGEHSH